MIKEVTHLRTYYLSLSCSAQRHIPAPWNHSALPLQLVTQSPQCFVCRKRMSLWGTVGLIYQISIYIYIYIYVYIYIIVLGPVEVGEFMVKVAWFHSFSTFVFLFLGCWSFVRHVISAGPWRIDSFNCYLPGTTREQNISHMQPQATNH